MMKKRILAALLCICMAASLLPTAAWAQEDKTDVCGMQIRYDGGLGSVFSADGAVPAGNADEYVFSETWNEATVGSTVRLLIDPERVLDWDRYNQTGEMRFIDPRPIDGRGIYVSARYEISEGNWFDGYVVENNVAVQEGFTFADGVLSFTPQTGENMEFDVQWSADEYDYVNFHATAACPILLEFSWFGYGEPDFSAVSTENKYVAQNSSRAKVLVPADAESFTLTWADSYHVRRVRQNGHDEVMYPDGSYLVELSEYDAENPDTHYCYTELEFTDDNFDGEIRLSYDQGWGSVFCSLGDEAPAKTVENYVWNEGVFSCLNNGVPQQVNLLIDEAQGIDWDVFNDTGEIRFRDPGSRDDRELFIFVQYENEYGDWIDEEAYGWGNINNNFFSYEDGVFSFTPKNHSNYYISVYWCEEDYQFGSFLGTENDPILVNVNWNDNGSIWFNNENNGGEVRGNNRLRTRLSADAEYCEICWSDGDRVRCIEIDGGQTVWFPEGNEYRIPLTQKNDDGSPRNWYDVHVEFLGDNWNSELSLDYDDGNGLVFMTVGDEQPQGLGEELLLSWWRNDARRSFADANDGTQLPVYLLLDQTRALDGEEYDRSGCIEYVDPWMDPNDRDLNIVARYEKPDGSWFDGPVVEHGAAVAEGFAFANNILAFAPQTAADIQLDVYWTREDYEFNRFGGTEEKPIIVSFDWNEHGSVNIPAGIADEDTFVQQSRAKVRLPIDTESLTFTWETETALKCARVDRDDRQEEIHPHDGKLVLPLDETWENGAPKDYYHLNFDFADENEYNHLLGVYYNDGLGSAFVALGGGQPEPTGEYYTSGEDVCFLKDGALQTVRILIDPTRALDWGRYNDTGEFVFTDPGQADDREINIIARFNDEDGNWFDEFVVRNGAAAQDGFTYQNNVLTFTPRSGFGVDINVFWTKQEYDFETFGPTEEKPVFVYINHRDCPELTVTPNENVESMTMYDQTKLRVAEGAGDLTLSWSEPYHVRHARLRLENGWEFHEDEIWDNNYEFWTGYQDDQGNPFHYYEIELELDNDFTGTFATHYNEWGGSVFCALGDRTPAATVEDYILSGWDGETSFYENGAIQTIRLLLDPTKELDWEAWERGEIRFIDVDGEGRSVFVRASWRDNGGYWHNDVLIENGACVYPYVQYENNVLTFTPENGCRVNFEIYWTQADYDYSCFGGTWEKPVVVDVGWRNDGEIRLADDIPEEDVYAQPDHARFKLRLPADAETVTFTWDADKRVSRLEADANRSFDRVDERNIEGNSYTLHLNPPAHENDEYADYYWLNFEFDDEWNYELIPHYDANGGSVFFALDEEPQATPQYYSPDNWNKSFRSEYGVGTVWMLLDETKALDWDAWQDGNGEIRFVDPWDSDDRAISVVAHYRRPNGEWVNEPLVEYGVAVDESIVTFEDNMLIFQPESGYEVELNVYWTRADYDFDRFGGTEEKPVVVHVDFWGSGEVFLPEGFSAESEDVFVQDSRFRLRVGRDVEELTFRWQKGKVINWIQVEGAGENGDWLQLDNPQLDAYTLRLDQTNWDGEPKDWYQFKIEFDYCQQDGLLTASYGSSEGSVFWAVGDGQPQATPAQYFFDGWDENRQGVSYVQNGEIVPVHLLLDETKAIDWDFYDRYGEVRFVDPMDISDRSISVTAHYRTADGWFDGPVVEYGQAVQEGFRFENNVLSFTPENLAEFRVEIYWNVASYEYSRFHGTEEKPVVVEANWWGEGEIPVPDVPEEDYILQDGRFMIRVPITQQSVTFTWDDKYLMKHVNVRNADGSWRVYSWPEGNSFTLPLDQTWDGEPGTFYRVIFDFADPNDDRSAIIANYDQSMGSVFWALDDAVPAANADSYLFSHVDDWASFVKDGQIHPVRLLLDETRAIDWDAWDDGELKFIDPWQVENRAIFVRARVITDDWERMETVVANGAVTAFGRQEGYAFENNVLTFTPKTRDDVELEIYWNQPDYDFACFGGTEDKPVLVSVYWWGEGEILTPEGIPEADVHRQEGRFRVRVPMQTEELTFRWDEQYEMGMIHVRVNGNWVELGPNGQHSYTLTLDQTDDNGWPETWYELNFDFAENRDYTMAVNYRQSEGSVFVGVNAPAAHDGPHYCNGIAGFGYEDESGDMQIGKVYFTLDPTVSIPYFGGGEYSEYPLPAWEGYSPTIWMGYRQADGWYFDGMIVKDGALTDAAVQRGFTFDGSTLVFTPETKNPIEVHVFWCADDEGYWEFRGTEAKPVEIELWQAMSQPLTLPGDIPAEDVFTYQGAEHIFRKYRVAQDREYFEISWPLWLEEDPNAIAYIEIECDNGESDAFWVTDASSYRLMLDQTYENGEPVRHYSITVWRGYVSKYNLALVTDGGEPEDGGFIQQIYDAGKAWCEQNEMEFKTYVPEYGPDNAIELAVREALDNGAGILLLPGYSFADITVRLAAEYPERFFILLDVTEDDLREAAEDEDYQVPENVYAAAYQEEQAGFLAGWAAVAMGCNKLAFLGGMAVPGVVRYGSGFVQGANAAAKALGRTEEVTVDYAYCNQFYPSETVEDYVTGWYENGVEVVFACGGGICWSAAAAAEACGGKLIGVDADQAAQLGESMTVTSAVKELGRTVTTQLDKLFADEFVGKAELLGITSPDPTQNYVGLARSTQWCESFTRDDYIALLSKIVSGEIEISDDVDERPQTEIFVDYNCYFGHEWGEPTYEWSADNSTVTAKRVCVNEDYHVETETVSTTSAVTVEPGCLTAGERTYTAEFENTAFTKQTKTAPIQALGHDFGAWTQSKAPTCTAKGEETRKCSRCNETEKRDVAALGHDFGAWTQSKAPTCTAKGEESRKCSRCDATETRELDALGHTPGEPVDENVFAPDCESFGGCDEVVRCTVCNEILSSSHVEYLPLGHDFGAWTQAKAPTCTAKGEESRKCSRCDKAETRELDALGHDFGAWTQTKAPSCTEKGEESRKCSRCDEVEKRDVAALGHKPGTAVRENEKAPTCTEKGSYDEVVRCTVCQTELSREKKETAALGHDFGEWKQEKAPTCTETGVEIRVCSRCDETEKRDVDKTAHTFVNGVCKVCGEKDPNYGPTISFVDVQEGAFYYDAVMWAVAHDPQITSGTDLTHFSPNNPCTRGQVVAFLWRASGCPEPKSTTHPFTDVKEGAFYYKAMLWAVENGITTGASKTTFAPNKPCTRGQVVTFLWRSVGSPEPQTTLHPFVDVKDSGFYYKAMLWAVENGITTGASKTAFAPDKTCTRGQVVTFLYRTYAKR